MITLKEISKKKFHEIKNFMLFKEEKANNCFATISDDNYSFKLAWSSDTLKPVVEIIQPNIYGIGIDQHFSIINFGNGAILTTLNLTYNLYDIKIHNNKIFVITELEIITMEINNLCNMQEYALPDFFESIEFLNNVIEIKCMNNEIETINIPVK